MNNGLTHQEQPRNQEEQLGRSFKGLLELPGQVMGSFRTVLERMDALEHHVRAIARRQDQFEQLQRESLQAMRALYAKHEVLEDASRRNSKLTDDHFFQRIVIPLGRHLIGYLDIAEAVMENAQVSQQEAVLSGVFDLLSHYGIETLTARRGDRFDPSIMKPLMRVPTCDRAADRLVHSMIRRGYRHHNDQLLRPVEVRLYRAEGDPSSEPHALTKGTHSEHEQHDVRH